LLFFDQRYGASPYFFAWSQKTDSRFRYFWI